MLSRGIFANNKLRPLYWTSRPGLCYIVGCLALESVADSGNWFPEEISYLSDEMTPVGSLTVFAGRLRYWR